MAQTQLFANVAELSALSVFTFLSSRFTVVSVPFKVIVLKTNQLTCHSFTGDLYMSNFASHDEYAAKICSLFTCNGSRP